jgi:prevent-host-death family protein
MNKRVSATDAKNIFGGLLEDVAALGRVEVVRHGRLVAVVLSPREWRDLSVAQGPQNEEWRRNHMIPASLARAARQVSPPANFDDADD